jgi:hypothetical protein
LGVEFPAFVYATAAEPDLSRGDYAVARAEEALDAIVRQRLPEFRGLLHSHTLNSLPHFGHFIIAQAEIDLGQPLQAVIRA